MRLRAFLFLLLVLSLPLFAGAADIDLSRYEMDVDYSKTGINEILPGGYLQYEDESASFKWKIDIFLPEESPLVGLGPFTTYATIVMHLKDINGTIFVPITAAFDGMEQYPVVEREKVLEWERMMRAHRGREVTGREELTVSMKFPAVSFLGNNMFDPPARSIIAINGARLNSSTIYVPKSMKLLDYMGHIRTFRVNDHAIFSHVYYPVSVVYANEFLKLLIQIALGLVALFFVFLVLKGYKYIPTLDFKSKHLLALLLITCLLMMQLGFLIPNPNATVWELHKRPEYEGSQVASYLIFIAGFTDSVDVLIVKSSLWWQEDIFSISRMHFLPMKSAEKIIILKNLEAPPASIAAIEKNFGKEKVVFAEEDEIPALVNQVSRAYPWGFLFDYSRRVVFGLFLLASFLATAFLFLRAFEVKKPLAWLAFLVVIVLTAFGLQFGNIITGFIAHMPVTYHGASTVPFTMSANFIPIFHQAHSLRMVVLALGPAFVFIFHRRARKATSIHALLIPVLILTILFTLPQTEFSVKRGAIALACGNCGITYSGSMEALNFQKAYSSLRENEAISSFVWESQEEYTLANKLETQGKYEEALDLYEDLVINYPDSLSTCNGFMAIARLHSRLGRKEEAIGTYLRLLERDLTEVQRAGTLKALAYEYETVREYEKAEAVYGETIDWSTDRMLTVDAYKSLGSLYQRMGRHEDALGAYAQIVETLEMPVEYDPWEDPIGRQLAEEAKERMIEEAEDLIAYVEETIAAQNTEAGE